MGQLKSPAGGMRKVGLYINTYVHKIIGMHLLDWERSRIEHLIYTVINWHL